MEHSYMPTKKDLLVSLAVAVFGAAVFFATLYFVQARRGQVDIGLASAGETLVGVEEVIGIKRDLSEREDDISRIENFFVPTQGEVGFIEQIERLASTKGVEMEIASVLLEEYKEREGFETLRLRIKFTGGRASVLGFLTSLERIPYAVTLNTLDLKNEADLGSVGEVDLAVIKVK